MNPKFVNEGWGSVQNGAKVDQLASGEKFADIRELKKLADGFHQHLDRGYVYFSMAFSLTVELINLRVRERAIQAQQRQPQQKAEE